MRGQILRLGLDGSARPVELDPAPADQSLLATSVRVRHRLEIVPGRDFLVLFASLRHGLSIEVLT